LETTEIQARTEQIRHALESDERYRVHRGPQVSDKDVLAVFMATLFHKSLLKNVRDMYEVVRDGNASMLGCETTAYPDVRNPKALGAYIREGKYVLTIRKNLLYVVRRNYMHYIPFLGMGYGMIRLPLTHTEEDHYWWNAESQFQAVCYHSNLTIYNYDTEHECASLYNFKKEAYFDDTYNLKSDSVLYCLIRGALQLTPHTSKSSEVSV
jgi:hypothetical protein